MSDSRLCHVHCRLWQNALLDLWFDTAVFAYAMEGIMCDFVNLKKTCVFFFGSSLENMPTFIWHLTSLPMRVLFGYQGGVYTSSAYLPLIDGLIHWFNRFIIASRMTAQIPGRVYFIYEISHSMARLGLSAYFLSFLSLFCRLSGRAIRSSFGGEIWVTSVCSLLVIWEKLVIKPQLDHVGLLSCVLRGGRISVSRISFVVPHQPLGTSCWSLNNSLIAQQVSLYSVDWFNSHLSARLGSLRCALFLYSSPEHISTIFNRIYESLALICIQSLLIWSTDVSVTWKRD